MDLNNIAFKLNLRMLLNIFGSFKLFLRIKLYHDFTFTITITASWA